ncbi:MAG: histidine phosphatase family protein [Kiritimatiellae bacterium]|nr:histidine phosphatase family protein [Kiritimatiellia bacterium]
MSSNLIARSIFLTMKHLYLIRHAKSSWNHPGLTDHQRPLNERGQTDAPQMAQWLADRTPAPNRLISSTATRARQTALAFAQAFQLTESAIQYEARIYEADLADLLEVTAGCPDEINRLLLVGHNPVISAYMSYLTDGGACSMPTCAIASLDLDISSWAETTRGLARLTFLVSPKHHP